MKLSQSVPWASTVTSDRSIWKQINALKNRCCSPSGKTTAGTRNPSTFSNASLCQTTYGKFDVFMRGDNDRVVDAQVQMCLYSDLYQRWHVATMAFQHCVSNNNCITRSDAYGYKYPNEECHVHSRSRFGEAAHDVRCQGHGPWWIVDASASRLLFSSKRGSSSKPFALQSTAKSWKKTRCHCFTHKFV